MTWISYGSTTHRPVVPLLLVAPKFLADEITDGVVAIAFVQVQAALCASGDSAGSRLVSYAAIAQSVISAGPWILSPCLHC
jgi:hypothetical protein